jgi:hypothetical protein
MQGEQAAHAPEAADRKASGREASHQSRHYGRKSKKHRKINFISSALSETAERTHGAAGGSVLVYQFRDVALLERSQQRVFT